MLSPNQLKTKKKRSSPQSGTILGQNLEFIGADSHIFVYHPDANSKMEGAEISLGETKKS